MEKRIRIPDTDLAVYPIGLGTAGAGLERERGTAERVFDTYLDCGGNLIDTAHVYSDWVPGERARSERVIGDWLAKSGKRNRIVLMTKGGHPEIAEGAPNRGQSRMTAEDMRIDLEDSLRKLRTDCIDIYFYHRDDRSQTVEEEIEAMESFVREGKIRCYACSNWDTDRMLEAGVYCREKGYRGFVADQSLLNIGMKYMEDLADATMRCTRGEAYQFHIEHPEVLEMPFSGNCNGYFQNYLSGQWERIKGSNYDTEKNREAAERIRELTHKYNCSVTQAVMGFFRYQPFACVPLYATSNPARVADVCGTLEIPFAAEDFFSFLPSDKPAGSLQDSPERNG